MTARHPHTITGRLTRYEIVLTDGTTTYLLGYSHRRSRSVLRDVIVDKSAHIRTAIGTANVMQARWNKRTADGMQAGTWQIKFSGRTERECYGHEHTDISTLPKAPAIDDNIHTAAA